MKHLISFLLIVTINASCSQISLKADKEEIQALKEKNEALEKELQELRAKYEPDPKIKRDYFIIGSTEDEVLEVMGQPSAYMNTTSDTKKFHYGLSTVYFYKGKVISYDNLGDKLKVKVK